MLKELTLVLVKPDAVQRGMIGKIVSRFEDRGLTIRAMKMVWCTKNLAAEHYREHANKIFFSDLIEFITSAPLVAMVLEGSGATSVVRGMIGATDCRVASVGTIRGDFGCSTRSNLVHASDGVESARREIPLWFSEGILDWQRTDERWTNAERDPSVLSRPITLAEFMRSDRT